jgi:indolepyruvate decarboxylase
MQTQTCVGTYLTTRLQQLGVNHLFSVPGDYTSDLLEIVDTQSTIARIGNCNELNAGYAADGYARANGLGAVAVTTGVGAFSLLNAIGGAYVEMIPVIAIIGTLSNTKLLDEINAGELFHHNVGTMDTNRKVYQDVTVAFERITDPLMAPTQIDNVLTACISKSRPVVIEIMEDCYYMPCASPQGTLTPVPLYEPLSVLQQMASASPPNKYAAQIVNAINGAATQIYQLLTTSKYPVFWIGNELSIYNLQSSFLQLLNLVQAPFVSSLLGKASIAENNPWYAGMWDGVFTQAYSKQIMANCDCLIGLGAWNTDLNVFGAPDPTPGNVTPVFAARNMVKVGEDLYVQVSLTHLLEALIGLIQTKGYTPVWQPISFPSLPTPPSSAPITYDYFFDTLNYAISSENLIIADVGLSTFGGSSYLTIPRQNGFLVQAIWASIGWSVPAGLGASFTPETRAMVIVGDGAFKLTCQEISTMIMQGCNTVIFVLNNTVYGVEQILLNPAPYEAGSNAPFEAANVLQTWDYVSLMNAFSNNNSNVAMSANVNTVQDLLNVLTSINENPDVVWLVNVNLNERDYPAAWQPFVPSNQQNH